MSARRAAASKKLWYIAFLLGLTAGVVTFSVFGFAQMTGESACRIHSAIFDGWQAEQLENRWVRLTVVPQLGGRLMQVEFGGHLYLFVNPRYKGQYIPPSDPAAKAGWINYGGDKIWPLPEGSGDEQHWPGPFSDLLDDGQYSLKIISRDSRCTVRLAGPSDPQTGLQYSREISIGDSPEISFHAEMKNASSHPIAWSVQSVTQYDLADAGNPATYNHQFRAFAPLNPRSAYPDGYHVRAGLADDPSFSVKDGLFVLHWLDLQNEVWLDSTGGWIAMLDGAAQYAMVERFSFQNGGDYPGHATVIFYKNGPAVELNSAGAPALTSADPAQAPYYMEAELNSPMAQLRPGETYALDTAWFPTRLQSDLVAVAHAGAIARPLAARFEAGRLTLTGAFGVFFSGKLVAHLYDARGRETNLTALQPVTPLQYVVLRREIAAAADTTRVSLHLVDEQGKDEGSLGEAKVEAGKDL